VPLCKGCPKQSHAYPEVTRAICRVPSAWFSQAPWYTLPDHLCRFRVRSLLELFPGTTSLPLQSNKLGQVTSFVTSNWPRNIHLVPIDYAFRPHLRGRLTLRRLALRRNPWSFGESVSHTLSRYSCQHSHFRYLQPASRLTFNGLRNAPLPLAVNCKPIPSAHGLSPVTFSAQDRLTSELLRFL
jgi:hypothetical protein